MQENFKNDLKEFIDKRIDTITSYQDDFLNKSITQTVNITDRLKSSLGANTNSFELVCCLNHLHNTEAYYIAKKAYTNGLKDGINLSDTLTEI